MIPRIVVAGTGSGVGKTTVACGLIGALRAAGRRVQAFKVGPDYIDPSYHRLASGRPGRNLDAFLSGSDLIAPLFRHGSAGADIAVIEGVMGMFDGVSGRGELASTAHIAKLLRAPVLLVIDGTAMARSAAAVVHGFRSFDPAVEIAGVVLNRVGSAIHEQLLREAIESLGVIVLGALRRSELLAAPERHLGLVPAGERERRAAAALDQLAALVARQVDVAAVQRLAAAAPALPGPAWSPSQAAPEGPSDGVAGIGIAIAGGPAFSFHYEENLELLTAAGARLLAFDPTVDTALPAGVGALVLAGGFPEIYGAELSANRPLRGEVAAFAAAGRPVLAECGGLLYLAERLDGHEMCGVLPARVRMSSHLTLGYREARTANPTAWLAPDTPVRGHEFHYSRVEPAAGAVPAWELSAHGATRAEGFVWGGVQASYLHVHWAAWPGLAHRFVAAAAGMAVRG
ncbi:MAG TPA: cobyrinate a,c-diamide synthase [Solirubrobacteraceae bacterium]|nr:cobyrinate a,c-diamide synthase [Solirubrobacteraceae bacterium]